MKTAYVTILIAGLLLAALSCNISGGKEHDDGGISLPSPVYPQVYSDPSVSPDGTKLLFVRNKITRLDRQGGYLIDPDSSGIWVADLDGGNMKLLIQSQNVGSPSFSPDMKWVLFEGGAQIYKVPFAEDSVMMDSLVQLTSEGRNFFPDWSPDGKWIAYSNTIGDTVGIWISPTNGSSEKYYFTYGAEPDWLIDGNQILYGNQGLWIEKIDHSDKMQLFEESNKVIRNIEANELEKRITFSSNESNDITLLQVFTIDFDGSNLEKITSNGGGRTQLELR